ncbi:MAG: hypothetical protein IGS38_18310 [Synechococcales cyanobacterium M58_A2018_015]|nr:hypothetical protein [Synechococcales cyanobacterium M58_A2018_015]
MNVEYLRKALKTHWLNYYRKNRDWLIRLGVWITCEGTRRPSSSFILGTLSTLEPQLTELLPLVVDLSSHPDRIVMALGLNFNPEEELQSFVEAERPPQPEPALLPSRMEHQMNSQMNSQPDPVPSQMSSPIPHQTPQTSAHPESAAADPANPIINHFPPRRVPVDSLQLSKSELPDRHRTALDPAAANTRKPKTRRD